MSAAGSFGVRALVQYSPLPGVVSHASALVAPWLILGFGIHLAAMLRDRPDGGSGHREQLVGHEL